MIVESDCAEANGPLMAEEASLRASQERATTPRLIERLNALADADVTDLLERLLGLPVAEQVETFRTLYPYIEAFADRLRFRHPDDLLPAMDRPLPRYWAPRGGVAAPACWARAWYSAQSRRHQPPYLSFDSETMPDWSGLPGEVLPAVDRAVELGLADPDRVAVMGHSYGSYCAPALLIQTDAFRTTIFGSDLSNLRSVY